jgi:hypothetical protein
MKKFFSVLLSLIIVFNSFGYILLYIHMSLSFKQEAFEKINKYISRENLTLISFNKSEIESVFINFDYDYDDEICYAGKMFDICEKEINNDIIYLYCLSDEDEDALNSSFCEFINANLNDHSQNIPVVNVIKGITYDWIMEHSVLNFNISFKKTKFDNSEITLNKIFLIPPTPPPRINSQYI